MTDLFEPDEVAPVLVHIVGDESTRKTAADFGSWNSWKLLGTEQPFQVLPQSIKRSRAIIWVLPGYLDNNTLGAVFFGTLAQVQARSPSDTAGIMVSGQSIEIQNAQGLWCVGDGVKSLTVTVLDERYA